MILIEKTETYGWEAAIRGMRNPKNSWGKSDTHWHNNRDCKECPHENTPCNDHFSTYGWCFKIGENDLKLMKILAAAGNDHGKFLRMIAVTMDVTAPLYWWKEFDTYKVGTVADSCSTMHKIHAKEFTIDDFSHEHLINEGVEFLRDFCELLNCAREIFVNWTDIPKARIDPQIKTQKDAWWQMIQLLPTSYNQKRTISLNYAVLKNIYHARRNHKLDEWHVFCEWIEQLPYSELITG